MGYENVGRVWTYKSLEEYLRTIKKPDWCEAITLHNTGEPSLANRPTGFSVGNIGNIRNYYKNDLGWSAGPHLFIDEDEIYGMSDLRRRGVHAVSFNRNAIGIEVLGWYDKEDPKKGRGLACWQNAAAASGVLLNWLNLEPNEDTVLFHRDDPTTSKTCPGTLVKKDWILNLIKKSPQPPEKKTEKPDVGMPWPDWDFRGESWCVPVYNFLMAKGVPSATIIAKLKSKGSKFYYGDEFIEGAYFVKAGEPIKPNGCTWAPALELLEICKECKTPS